MSQPSLLPDSPGQTILDRSLCMTLQCTVLGNSRNVKGVRLTTDSGTDVGADRKEWSVNKRLLKSQERLAAVKVIETAKSYLRTVSTNMHSVFGPGVYLIPTSLLPTVEERLHFYKNELSAAVDALVNVYPHQVAEREQVLGLLYNAADYVSVNEVRRAFSLEWNYVSFAVPERLQTVDRAAFELARAKYQTRLSDAYDEVVVGLRASALKIMKDLATRLAPGADGKRKSLHKTALDELSTFGELLDARNITNDTELPAAIARVQALSRGMDIEQLKNDDTMRKALHDAATTAAEALDGLVKVTGRRAISLHDA
jgi:hypothetical protein